MQSFWNPTQQIGSSPTILDWEVLVSCDWSVWNISTHHDGWQQRSARPRLNRVTSHRAHVPVRVVSSIRVRSHSVTAAIGAVAVRLRTRYDDTGTIPSGGLMLSGMLDRLNTSGEEQTNCARSMQHADAEIPQEESAVVADTTEPICLLVAAPRVEGN